MATKLGGRLALIRQAYARKPGRKALNQARLLLQEIETETDALLAFLGVADTDRTAAVAKVRRAIREAAQTVTNP